MSSPSETELALLKLLWEEAPLSAREMQDRLPSELDWALSTTRTVLERMRGKGLLIRSTVHGTAVYAPGQAKVAVLGGSLRRLLRHVLEVEGDLPVAAFAGSRLLSPTELSELEALLNAEAPAPTPADEDGRP